jgi:hypothetical protein
MNPRYAWQKPYVAAVREADPSKRVRGLQDAGHAMRARARELKTDHRAAPEEQVALEYAFRCLQIMRQRGHVDRATLENRSKP